MRTDRTAWPGLAHAGTGVYWRVPFPFPNWLRGFERLRLPPLPSVMGLPHALSTAIIARKLFALNFNQAKVNKSAHASGKKRTGQLERTEIKSFSSLFDRLEAMGGRQGAFLLLKLN